MSLHEDITTAMQQEIEAAGDAIVLLPSRLAQSVQRRFHDAGLQPHIQYTSLEHLKQIARRALADSKAAAIAANATMRSTSSGVTILIQARYRALNV